MPNMKTFFLLFIALLASCSSADKKEPKAISRPDTIETEIMIEGMAESLKMYLMKSSTGFPLQFSTYIPVEMRIDSVRLEHGRAIHIVAAFGGRLNKEARLTIFAFLKGVSEEKVQDMIHKKNIRAESITPDSTGLSWAKEVYKLKGNRSGFLALAKENDTWFYLLATYPPEYGDGMAPRLAMIMEKWRWKESGMSLR